MPKLLKILAVIIGSLVLLLAAALVAVLLLVDPNDYKDDIAASVHMATGRELTLAGDLELSVFPWLGLSLGETSLGNAPGFGKQPMARVAAVDIKVKLLPLLARRVEMKTVRLHGLRLNLQRATDGRTNWQDLLAAPKPVEKPTAREAAPAPGLAAIAIGGVELSDARIEWDDRLAGQRVVVDKLTLHTGALAPPTPVDVSLSADVAVDQPALQSHVSLAGRVTADFDAQHFRVDDMELAVEARGATLPFSPLSARLNTTVDAPLTQGQISIDPLQLQIAGLSLNGKVRIAGLDATPMLTGQLAMETFSPRKLAKDLGISLPATTDAAVFTKAAASLQLEADAAHLAVTQLAVTLDDSHFSGSANVRNFEQPALRFDLKLDALNADRYLPPPATPATASAPDAPAPTALPLDMLRALNVDGHVGIGKLTVAKAHLSEIQLGIKAKSGQLRLHPATANLYDGKFSGDIGLDARGATPKLSLEELLSGVQVGPLLKDMLGNDAVLGSADATSKLAAQGVELDGILKTLEGQARVEFKNGAVKGINIGQLLREAYAKLKKLPPPPKTEEQTDFAAIEASVVIDKGVVNNHDLKANAPALRVTGEGKVDLPRQRIDYRLTTTLVESLEGQGGEEAAELKGLPIPIKISGSFDKPQFALDLKPLLEAKVKEELEHQKQKLKKEVDKKLEEEKEKAKQKLEKKLKEKLKGLF